MGAFNPDNYAPVDQRIAEFYAQFPDGTIRTFVAAADETSIMFEARIFRGLEEARDGIYTSGFAHEVKGSGPVNRTNHVENAETSAVGRALANLGFSGSINGKRAPRPSREEMEQAERRRSDHAEHEALLSFIREAGKRGTEAMQTAIRTRWDAAKQNRREARALADFVEESTGERAPT